VTVLLDLRASGMDPLSRSGRYLMLVEAEVARGRFAEAAAWADRADGSVLPRQAGTARLARAYALLPTDPAAAAREAGAAARALTAAADPIGAGLAHLTLATASASLGEAGHARAGFLRARDLFTRSGAHLLAARAEAGLARR